MSDCPSLFGRLNKLGDAPSMMKRWADISVSSAKAKTMTAEELSGKVITGEFVNVDNRMEYTAKYAEIIKKAQEV